MTNRGGRRTSAIVVLSVSLGLLAILICAALVLHIEGSTIFLSAPGRILMECFSWAAFFIPAYFLVAVVLLIVPVFKPRFALMLMLSIIPFLTASILFLVIGGSSLAFPMILATAFGVTAAAVLLSTLLILEILFIVTLPFGLSTVVRAGKTAEGGKRAPLQLPAKASARKAGAGDEASQRGAARQADEPLAPRKTGPIDDLPRTPARIPARARKKGRDDEEPIEVEAELIELPPEPLVPRKLPSVDAEAGGARREPSRRESIPAGKADVKKGAGGASQQELQFPPGSKSSYGIPVDGVLKLRPEHAYWEIDEETRAAADILTAALQEFNIQAEVTGIRKGPVITLFEVLPAQGVRVSKIANLSDNIALRLAAPSVRIVAPIPGKHAVGIEVPNRKRAIVSFREMVEMQAMQKSGYEIPIALGKDILGEAQIIDLIQTPHLLIGGATNSGKSVLVNAVICSILFNKSPEEVRLFLIDPKIVELKFYNDVPHLLTPVITEPRKAFQALQYCISEMERRYMLLDALGVRDIRAYNKKARKEKVSRLPFIVVVIDEFADLMATTGKELESTLARLAAMARAVGIHMVLATQRPSIDVITGLIKANIPSRIAFMVANKFDSRIIIDSVGAEKLLGKGDMLLSAAWNPFPVRIQGAFVDEEEVEAICEYVKKLGAPQYIDDEVFFDDEEGGKDYEGEPGNDPLFDKALEVVIAQGKASASYIQRRLKVGYNRAARLVEEMETRGIVGPAQGSKPRELIHVPKGEH